jgi:hypothetical protein
MRMKTSTRSRARRRSLAAILATLASTTALVALAPGVRADTSAIVDDKSVSAPVTEWTFFHVSPDYVSSQLSEHKARLTHLQVVSTNPYRLTVTMVKNTGVYQVSLWWWYYDVTGSQIRGYLKANQARLIDLTPVGTGATFAAIMVANTGPAQRGWHWWFRATASTIASDIAASNLRLTDLKSYVDAGGNRLFTAIAVVNSGTDAKAWSWYLGVTRTQVTSYLTTNGDRLVSLWRRSDGSYDVIMFASQGEYADWYTGMSINDLAGALRQGGYRIIGLQAYTDGGNALYNAVTIDNLDPETRRIWAVMDAGLHGGQFGFYIKLIGGSTLIDRQGEAVFEPASAIKVVYHAYAMHQVYLGLDSLSSPFAYWVDPDDPSNIEPCPDPAWEVPANEVDTTLENGLDATMQASDNRTTRGLQVRYGEENVNDFAYGLGMKHTELRQIIGCGFQNGLRNDFTLADAGILFEKVANGTLLGTGTERQEFWDIMLGGPQDPSGALADIVREEAAKLGKTSDQADTYIANMSHRAKGGSYDLLCETTGCNTYNYIRTGVGRMILPYMQGGVIHYRYYVYGSWVNDLMLNCSDCTAKDSADAAITDGSNEMWRSVIDATLGTF